ncbi:MAG TPA: glycosyltransferase family 2 protein [Mycobacteriales bacterium]|nr:glycosyltransferase family 2 protein [Mycobacteriales bacterium]
MHQVEIDTIRSTRGFRRRQVGADRRSTTPSVLPPAVSERRLTGGRLAVVVTLLAWAIYTYFFVAQELVGQLAPATRAVSSLCWVIVTFITASSLAYLVSRLGFFARSRAHRRVTRAELDEFYAASCPTLTALVPSYKEEVRVVRNTVLSAALQEYPDLRVVLLLDDPPNPTDPHDRATLAATRSLIDELSTLLAEPAREFEVALLELEQADDLPDDALGTVTKHYDVAIDWLVSLAAEIVPEDHADEFFVDSILLRLAADLRLTASAMRAAHAEQVVLPREQVHALLRRLLWIFRAEIHSFERKQFASLSAEPNKAMNLNSYLGLMGGSYRDRVTSVGRVLLPCAPAEADIGIPNPDYVLTLDADSVILPEYCARLVYLMEQSEHARTAVMQTPYSAYPGAETRLERIAGATTDLQYVVHQGMARHDAAFWVGANAILRKPALDEICEVSYNGDFEIRRYVQDRTVIEDTESSIDLRIRGWNLLSYPERLAYSATPADFGSLCIQRRRWANGGLLILHRLWQQRGAMKARGERLRLREVLLRANYMASIAWCSFSLAILLLVYPSSSQVSAALLGAIAVPYFACQASDLRYYGYKRLDALRMYGFNMLLLPVNIAGVVNSIVQAVTGEKSAFGRTPKVLSRTVPTLTFIVAPYLVLAMAGYEFDRYFRQGLWVAAGYSAANLLFTLYALAAFIGLRTSLADLAIQLRARLYVPVRATAPTMPDPLMVLESPPTLNWAAVLDIGAGDLSVLPASKTAESDERKPLASVTPLPLKVPRQRGAAAGQLLSAAD